MSEKQGYGARHGLVRLQRYLADSGVASRRHAEEMIRAGKVMVNDVVRDEMPVFVDPENDRVFYSGRSIRPQKHQYILLHKPVGYITSTRDEKGRRRIYDLLPGIDARVFPVGRLDLDSSGLLLLTNDGELAAKISHPRYAIPKVYRVDVRGQVPEDIVARMKKGIWVAEGRVRATEVEVIHRSRDRSILHITLREGKNRQIRRMLLRLGCPVKKLKRISIGPLTVKGLADGACRRLTHEELLQLRKLVITQSAKAETQPSRKRRRRPAPRPRTPERVARQPEPEAPEPPRRRVVSE